MYQQFANSVQNESKPTGFSAPPNTTHVENGVVVQDMQVALGGAGAGGDSVFWLNKDHATNHQPYPTSGAQGAPGAWGPEVTPQASSQQMNPPGSGVYPYACAIHPEETGMIHVANAISIDVQLGGGALFNPPVAILPPLQTIGWGTPQQRVSWSNSDSAAHQPTPQVIAPWFTTPTKPGDVSAQVVILNNGDINYSDLKNPSLTGKISNPVPIAATNTAQSLAASAYAGQSISWTNNDTVAHQPAPVGGPANAWFAAPIPANATVSSNVFSKPGSFSYQIDGAGPTGTVTITPAPSAK